MFEYTSLLNNYEKAMKKCKGMARISPLIPVEEESPTLDIDIAAFRKRFEF